MEIIVSGCSGLIASFLLLGRDPGIACLWAERNQEDVGNDI